MASSVCSRLHSQNALIRVLKRCLRSEHIGYALFKRALRSRNFMQPGFAVPIRENLFTFTAANPSAALTSALIRDNAENEEINLLSDVIAAFKLRIKANAINFYFTEVQKRMDDPAGSNNIPLRRASGKLSIFG